MQPAPPHKSGRWTLSPLTLGSIQPAEMSVRADQTLRAEIAGREGWLAPATLRYHEPMSDML